MTNRSLSWIDPEKFAEALRRADPRPPKPPPLEPAALGFWSAAAESAVAERRPVLAAKGHAPVETFKVPHGTMGDRLKAFFEWTVRQTHARQLFLIDEDGLALMDSGAEPLIVATASSIVNLLERLGGARGDVPAESVTIDRGPDRVLQIVLARTPYGLFALGAVVDLPASRHVLAAVRVVLRQVLEAPALEK
jgi:hypothetical protein